MTKRHVLFLHVPKTAGVSIHTMIRAAVPAESINPAHPAHIISETDWCRVDAYTHFFSHVPLYIRSILPRPLLTFTFLRDPVDRVISAYNHMLRAPGDRSYELISSRRLGIVEALREPELGLWLCNVATRMLGADADLRRVFPDVEAMARAHAAAWSEPADDSTMERAYRRLSQLDFVGFTEQFHSDSLRLAKLLGLSIDTVPFENSSPRKYAGPAPIAVRTAETEAAIRSYSRYDVALYDRAREMFRAG